MKIPEVSVVIAVYNGETYLEETIDSILAQTFENFEILIVDDGSTDRSVEIIERFASDGRVRLIQREHGGIARALNAGFSEARASLVARIDADDVMLPERLQRQHAFMARNPSIGGAASTYWIVDEKGTIRGFNDSSILSIAELDDYLANGGRFVFPAPTMMLRRDVVLGLGGYNPDYTNSEDCDLFMRMIVAKHPIIFQAERLTKFRVHNKSQSSKNTKVQYYSMDLIEINYARHLAGQAPIDKRDYEADLKLLTWHRKLRHEIRVQSALALRRHHEAELIGNRLASAIHVGVAAALDMPRAYRKLSRIFNRRRVGRSMSEPQR